ncbi:MAG TPA: polyphenol oxidase family protein [Elusimicrobiales bacterium]|nr:polyphenol oxidase family protein [Elusimicrobiales bacterium]
MYTEEKNGLQLLRFDNFKDLAGVACAVSTRQGGFTSGPFGGLNLGSFSGDNPEAAAKNLGLFCGALGADPSKLAHMRQRHTANVAVVEAGAPRAENTDALVTAARGVPLLALSADCALTVFYDAEHKALAVAHSGWRGAFLNIYSAVLNVMRMRYGTAPENLTVGVSPMISAANYPVQGDFLEKLRAFYPGPEHLRWLMLKNGVHFFSLRELLRFQLEQLGVKKHEFMHLCTHERKDLFFSFRRDGAATGHFGLAAMLK